MSVSINYTHSKVSHHHSANSLYSSQLISCRTFSMMSATICLATSGSSRRVVFSMSINPCQVAGILPLPWSHSNSTFRMHSLTRPRLSSSISPILPCLTPIFAPRSFHFPNVSSSIVNTSDKTSSAIENIEVSACDDSYTFHFLFTTNSVIIARGMYIL